MIIDGKMATGLKSKGYRKRKLRQQHKRGYEQRCKSKKRDREIDYIRNEKTENKRSKIIDIETIKMLMEYAPA